LNLAWHFVKQAMVVQMRESRDVSPELATKLDAMIKEFELRFAKMASTADADQRAQLDEMFEPRTIGRIRSANAGRDAPLDLRDQGKIGDEVRREVKRLLDLQELQFSAS